MSIENFDSIEVHTKIIAYKTIDNSHSEIRIARHKIWSNVICGVISLKWIHDLISDGMFLHLHATQDDDIHPKIFVWVDLCRDIDLHSHNDLNNMFCVMHIELPLDAIFDKFSLVSNSSSNAIPLNYSNILSLNSSCFKVADTENTIEIVPPKFFLYCTGSFKSGTTWLELMLNRHKSVFMLHEGNSLDLFDSNRLNDIKINNKLIGKDFINSMPFEPAFSSEFSNLLSLKTAELLLSYYASVVGVTICGDRTPNTMRRLYDCRYHISKNTKILHIVRNPFDVLVSLVYHEINLLKNSDDNSNLLFFDIDTVSLLAREIGSNKNIIEDLFLNGSFDIFFKLWADEQSAFDDMLAFGRYDLKLVRYEDILCNATYCLSDIYSFLGLEADVKYIGEVTSATSFESIANRPRGTEQSSSFYRKGVSNDYVNYFKTDPKSNLSNSIQQLIAKFGY